MPQPRILDFGPDPMSVAASRFGEGFSNQFVQNQERNQENDVLQNLLKKYNPENPQEFEEEVFGSNLPFEKKTSLLKSISDRAEATRKAQAEENKQNTLQRIFGGGQPTQTDEQSPEGVTTHQKTLADLSDSDISALQQIDPKAADLAIELRAERSKQFNDDRNFAWKQAEPVLKKIDAERESIGQKENAIAQMKEAIKDKTLIESTGDYLADLTGYEVLRSAKGSVLVTAGKEFLLGNISRAGARPNMWIEQQIGKMMPQAGRSEEANSKVSTMLESEVRLQKKRVETADALTAAFEQSLGYVPASIGREIDQAMKPYEQFERDKLSYDLRKLDEQYNGYKMTKVSQGTPLTLGMAKKLMSKYGSEEAAEKAAKELGYTIPSEDIYNGYLE